MSLQLQIETPRRRNRKRPKQRRRIFCPVHGCYLDSAGPKRHLFADQAEQLRARGISHRKSRMIVATLTTVPLDGEWLEPFWCDHCEETQWYHVCKLGDRDYALSVAPRDLWMQAAGVLDPEGNPSVGEFTRRSASMTGYQGKKQFNFVR